MNLNNNKAKKFLKAETNTKIKRKVREQVVSRLDKK
jgi:hypothetical protein